MTADSPFVTVVMPVRNEARFISGTLERILFQEYPRGRFEILVADGMSDDGTRDIVSRMAAQDDRIRLLDNPRKKSGAGRNVGFRAGRGDIFVVVDGHCHIPDAAFLRNVADCFEKSGAHCLGRPQPLDPPGLTVFQQSVALARASRLGHGGDSLIYGDHEGFASPVSNGAAYRREVFERVGYVDENFDACEDVEFNYRVERAGLTAYTSPRLTVRYYPRENLAALFSQMRRYGRGRTRFYRRHPEALGPKALVPAFFAGGATAAAILAAANLLFGLPPVPEFLLRALAFLLLAYAVLVGLATFRICNEEGWRYAPHLPLIFMAIHGGLGLGMWEEFLTRGQARARRRSSEGPIRVAYLIDTIHSPTAGTERQLLLLLKGLDRREFEPRLCVLLDSPWLQNNFSLCPLSVLDIRSFKIPRGWWNVLRFALWLRRERIDILQTHFRDASLAGILAAWLARVPGIVGTRKNQGYWMSGSELWLQKALSRLPDVFAANSENTRQWAHHAEGIALERIRVIHNGLDYAAFPAPSDALRLAARTLLGLPAHAPVVGIVANLRQVKRIDIFLRAAALVRAELPAARFVVVGEGEERGRLEKLAAELGLNDCLSFLGRSDDVAGILPAFDVGVLSSDSESFSNAVVEYMAAGLPVAATDVGGCREALGGRPAGILVATRDTAGLGSAIVRLCTEAGLRDYARENHVARVKEMFSRERYLEGYSGLYRDLLGTRKEGLS